MKFKLLDSSTEEVLAEVQSPAAPPMEAYSAWNVDGVEYVTVGYGDSYFGPVPGSESIEHLYTEVAVYRRRLGSTST